MYTFIVIIPRSTSIQASSASWVVSMGKIDGLNHLPVCKQMTDIKLNCYSLIEKFELSSCWLRLKSTPTVSLQMG